MEITQLQIKDALFEFFRSNSNTLSTEDKSAFDELVLQEQDMITLASFLARRIRKEEEQDVHNPLQAALLDLKLSLQELDGNRSVSLVKIFVLIAELMSLPGAYINNNFIKKKLGIEEWLEEEGHFK